MGMQFTGLQVVSWILLLIGTGVLAISLISDYWSIHTPKHPMGSFGSSEKQEMDNFVIERNTESRQFPDEKKLYQPDNLTMHRGILRQCITTRQYANCNFRFSSMFKQLRNFMDGYEMYFEKSMYVHYPAQSFEIYVALFIIISVMVASTVLLFGPFCCQKCKASTTLLIFITGVFGGSGCLIYWNANREGRTFTLHQRQFDDMYYHDYKSDSNVLSWSFFMAVGSTIILLFSAFLLCVSSRVDPDVEYEPTVTAV